MNLGPEEKKYNEWLKDQKENHGLTSIHVSFNINKIECNKNGNLEIEYTNNGKTREDLFKELNDMNEAILKGNFKPYIDDNETYIEKEITNL